MNVRAARTLGVIGALCVLSSKSVSVVPLQSFDVPAGLLSLASEPSLTFVKYLVATGVPSGIEIKEPDLPRSGRQKKDVDGRAKISAVELVQAFNDRHSDYRAEVQSGTIVIRPVNRQSHDLDLAAPQGLIQVRGAMQALERVFRQLDPSLGAPGGIVGSVLSSGADTDRGDQLNISIDPSGLPILGVLDHLAALIPGHAWLVITDAGEPSSIIRIGLIHRDGSTTERALAR